MIEVVEATPANLVLMPAGEGSEGNIPSLRNRWWLGVPGERLHSQPRSF